MLPAVVGPEEDSLPVVVPVSVVPVEVSASVVVLPLVVEASRNMQQSQCQSTTQTRPAAQTLSPHSVAGQGGPEVAVSQVALDVLDVGAPALSAVLSGPQAAISAARSATRIDRPRSERHEGEGDRQFGMEA